MKYVVRIRGGAIIETPRRLAPAEALLDAQVQSKRAVLARRLGPGDRVVSGPVPIEGREVLAHAVVRLDRDGEDAVTIYAVEPTS